MQNELERINLEQFNALRDLLEEDFDSLVEAFFEDSDLRMQEVRLAFDTGDNRLGYEAVHAMKGAGVNLGANLLSELCYKLQLQCQEKQITNSDALIRHIDEERLLLIQAIKQQMAI